MRHGRPGAVPRGSARLCSDPMATPTWLTRRVVGWSLYDLASSTYAGLVPVFFGVFFTTFVAAGAPAAQALWGAIAALGLVLSAVVAPFVGAWTDRHGYKVAAIAIASAACVLATLAMATGAPGRVLAMAVAFVAGQLGYALATTLYDSLLVRVAPRGERGRVSGFGWAMGFVGGIAALLVAIALMRGMPPAAQVEHLGVAFLACGVLFAMLALPGLAGLRQLAAHDRPAAAPGGASAFAAVFETLRHWRRQPAVFRFLLAYYLLNDVIVTLAVFIVIVMRARFGLAIDGLLWLAVLYNAIALPCTLFFGHASDRFGPRATIYAMAAILAASILLLAFGTGRATPAIVVILLGFVLGSLQAVCRSYLAQLVDPRQSAEIFGFNAIAGRLSAAVGPILFGVIASASGSETLALMSLLPFLAAGVWVISTVREPRARAPAAAD